MDLSPLQTELPLAPSLPRGVPAGRSPGSGVAPKSPGGRRQRPPKAFLRSGMSRRWLEALSGQTAVPAQVQGSPRCSLRPPVSGQSAGTHAHPPWPSSWSSQDSCPPRLSACSGSSLTSPSLTGAPGSGRRVPLLVGKKVAPTLAWLTQEPQGPFQSSTDQEAGGK